MWLNISNNKSTVESQSSVFAINRAHSSENLKISMDCRYICSYNRTFYRSEVRKIISNEKKTKTDNFIF